MKTPSAYISLGKSHLLGLCLLGIVTAVGVQDGRAQLIGAEWGNSFNTGNTAGSLSVTNVNSQWTTFTADSNFSVSSVWINSNSAMAANSGVNVEIYAVDPLTGKPTGAALASQLLSSAASGWTQLSGFNYTLTKGTAYALRLSAATSTSPAYLFRFLNSNRPAPYDNTSTVQPYSGDYDPYWARGSNNNSPTTTGQAVWLLESSSGAGFGQPYSASLGTNLGSSTAAVGQRFRFDAPDATNHMLENVELTLNVGATPPANVLTVRLLASDGTILTTGTLNLTGAVAGIERYTVEFDSAYRLTDQDFYYLALYSTNSTASSVAWIGGSTSQTLDSTFLDATFQGTLGYAVTWNSQSNFGTVATSATNVDYSFNLGLSAIPEPSTVALILGGLSLLGFSTWRKRAH